MDYEPRSESYLIFQRIITFLDEWFFYGLLLFLLVNKQWLWMTPAVLVGAGCIWHSYQRLWAMEDKRFGPLFEEDQSP
jgi:hypothetical protein